MSDEDNDNIESENDETEEVDNTEEVEETAVEAVTEDTGEDEEKVRLRELNKKLFERAKKAEAEAKALKEPKPEIKPSTPSEKQDGLTPMDAIILSKANLTEQEDIEEVMEFVNYKRSKGLKITIAEALKDKTLSGILREREEHRQTAQATSTGGGRRGSTKPSADQIMEDIKKGNLPENPEDAADAYWDSKIKRK